MHPGLRSSFFEHSLDAARTRLWDEHLIRSKLSKQTQECNAVSSTGPSVVSTVLFNLGEESFRLSNVMPFLLCQNGEASVDEISSYLHDDLQDSVVKKLRMDDGVVHYWVSRCARLPKLSELALHILATPTSSSSSKRDFSALKLMLNNSRMLLADDVVEDLCILKSSTSVPSTSVMQTMLAEEI